MAEQDEDRFMQYNISYRRFGVKDQFLFLLWSTTVSKRVFYNNLLNLREKFHGCSCNLQTPNWAFSCNQNVSKNFAVTSIYDCSWFKLSKLCRLNHSSSKFLQACLLFFSESVLDFEFSLQFWNTIDEGGRVWFVIELHTSDRFDSCQYVNMSANFKRSHIWPL